jgi:hypothetical protein
MARLIPVGFYKELRHGKPDGPSLREAIQATPGPDEARLAAYLRSGAVYLASPGPVRDVLAANAIIGSLSIQTDGTYAWPSDFAHYIEKHHARPPAELVAHIAANGFAVPEGIDLTSLELG